MRDQRIDFIKGMLMWCVVYGHAVNTLLCGTSYAPVWLHTFVRTFDMPFFMVLSGCFLRKSLERRGAFDVFINRLSMILLPIAVWTLIRGHVVFVAYYFLWAVLMSSIVCIVGSCVASVLPGRGGRLVEFLFYVAVAVLLHVVELPWNLFYLFPFFVVGYYADGRFKVSRLGFCIVSAVFVVGLCFWNVSYRPWAVGALAWKDSSAAFVVYMYRFALGVAGVYVMAKVFDVIWGVVNNSVSAIAQMIAGWGRETLALYILQSIVVERIGTAICSAAYAHHPITLTQPVVNLIGYFIAPLLSALVIISLMFVTRKIKSLRILKYAFGFKARTKQTGER